MKDEKQYMLSCENVEDLFFLKNLLEADSIAIKMQDNITEENAMGAEEIIIALITSTVIPSILNVIKTWIESKNIDLEITDLSTKKRIVIKSQNGKLTEDMKNVINKFFME